MVCWKNLPNYFYEMFSFNYNFVSIHKTQIFKPYLKKIQYMTNFFSFIFMSVFMFLSFFSLFLSIHYAWVFFSFCVYKTLCVWSLYACIIYKVYLVFFSFVCALFLLFNLHHFYQKMVRVNMVSKWSHPILL